MGMKTQDLVHRAKCGEAVALKTLKELFPRREFRRFWCDCRGTVLRWRAKGSRCAWKAL